MRNALIGTGLSLALAAFALSAARAGDPIILRPRAGTPPTVTDGRIDHARYHDLLEKYVDGRGLVDYASWKASGRPELERYLAAMSAVNPDKLADDDERLAYWINVYNALTLHGMLHFYPTKSIKDHVSRFWGFNFWDDVRIVVSGKERSLNQIEHEILRKMDEPRIHMAIVCASLGCPKLRNEAYVGSRIDAQLDENARDFFQAEQNFRIDRANRKVYLSSILKWFGEDFGGTDQSKLDFVARYVESERDRAFLTRTDVAIAYLEYDWRINDKPARGRRAP